VILDQKRPWKGVLAGTVGGIAGVFPMTALQLLFDHLRGAPVRAARELSQRGGRHDIALLKRRARRWRLPQKDATVRAAERISYFLRGKGITPRHRHISGVSVPYAFGALAGAAYGLAVEKYPTIARGSGLPFAGFFPKNWRCRPRVFRIRPTSTLFEIISTRWLRALSLD
jgi:hypothetical protein